ncbi:MAG: hypothetical protein R3E89_09030 [Thiolinea sp.]
MLRISFGGEKYQDTQGLSNTLDAQLTRMEQAFQVKKQFDHVGGRFLICSSLSISKSASPWWF